MTICINGTIEEWLPVDLEDEHGQAVRKRMLVFKSNESVMSKGAKQNGTTRSKRRRRRITRFWVERNARRLA